MQTIVEMRLTPEKTPDYSFEQFRNWLDTLAASHIMCCEENKSYHTRTPSTPHFHLLIITHLQKNSVRTSFKTAFPKAKGNQSFKFKLVKYLDRYERYCAKFNNPVYLRGYTKEKVLQLSKDFEEEFKKKKDERTVKTKMTRIKEYLISKGVTISSVTAGMLMYHIIEYHIDRQVTFNEYDVKKIHLFLRYEHMTTKDRIKFAQDLVQEF